jgi:tetratricopeptide (TPR) repeat protein
LSIKTENQRFTTPERILTFTNPHIEIMLHMAHEMKMLGDYEKALEIYDRVIEMDPRNARAYHVKGNIYDLTGRYDEAITSYNAALERDPLNAETWYNKGVTLRKMGRKDESDECLLEGVSRAL